MCHIKLNFLFSYCLMCSSVGYIEAIYKTVSDQFFLRILKRFIKVHSVFPKTQNKWPAINWTTKQVL